MDFTEIVTEVGRITKRADKLLDIRREVNAAIFFCIGGADFAADLDEVTVPITSTAYSGNISTANAAFTRFRKVAYIRPEERNKVLTQLYPDKIFQQGKQAVDVFYVSGTQINYNLARLSSNLLVSYYQYPVALSGTQTNWITVQQPYMLVDKAASKIFRNIGDDASAKRHEDDFNLSYKRLIYDLSTQARA